MNLPNQLTLARLIMAAIFVVTMTIAADVPYMAATSLLIFGIASFTDYLDGVIARKWNLITDFGKLFDPLADKILVAAAFICLIPLQAVPAWAVIIIIAREFLITGLRLLAAAKGTILPAEKLGKHKTLWQLITILFFLLLLTIRDFAPAVAKPGKLWMDAWVYGGAILIAVTVVLTLYSGLGYLFRNRKLLESI